MQSPVLRLLKDTRSLLIRNFGIAAPMLQKGSDPIQQLFVQKIREYKQKSSGGKLVEPSPELEREVKADLEKAARQFGGSANEDMTKFPAINFEDVPLDSTEFNFGLVQRVKGDRPPLKPYNMWDN